MRRLIGLLCLGLVLAACQTGQPNPSEKTSATAAPSPVAAATSVTSATAVTSSATSPTPAATLPPLKFTVKGDGKNVATVNGTALTLAEFERQANQVRDEFVRQGLDPNSDEGKQQLNQVYSQILETMIAQEIVRQGAKAQNVTVTEDDVKTELDRITQQQGGAEALKKALEAQGMTQDELVGLVRDRLTAVKLAAVLTKDLPTTAEQVHARHILVKTEDEAKKVIDRLKAGEDFGKLAGELSTDPGGKSNGGDLGWFGRGMMVPSFEEAAFALPVKQVSQPVQSQFGYHVIEVLEKDAKRSLPQDQIDQQREDKLIGWLEEQRKAANIEQFLTIEQ